MSTKRITVSVITLALLIGALPYHYAGAQSPEVQMAREKVEKSFGKAEDAKLSKQIMPAETIESRRKTLLSILDLTTAEIDDTLGEKKLASLIIMEDVGISTVAEQLSARLVILRGYAELVRMQVVREDVDMNELKEIALGFKNWREDAYSPTVRQAFDALLVVQGGDVLKTTRGRLERVNADVKKLQAAVGAEANVLVSMLETARKNVSAATGYQDDARSLLITDQQSILFGMGKVKDGAPKQSSFSRGRDGDFMCLPGSNQRSSDCQVVFKMHSGAVYALRTLTGSPLSFSTGDISSVAGSLVIVQPSFPVDSLQGLLFVDVLNPAEIKKSAQIDFSDELASVSDSLEVLVSTPTQTVQSLIKKEIDEINQAYKTFFSMSKLAKKLIAK